MRLRPRPTVKETLPDEPDNDVPLGGAELPHKAQKLLGTKVRVNVSNSKDNRRTDPAPLRKAGTDYPGGRLTTQQAPQLALPSGITDMPSWSNVAASTRSSSDILPTPTASPGQPSNSPRNGSSTGVQPSQFYPNHQQSIESLNREYYDPSKQPLYVSQQTSASAVRDMALHKGSPKVHEMASNQPHSKHARPASNAQYGDSSKKPRKLDLSSLFPRPSPSSAHLLSPAKYSSSPSALTESTEFFPQDTVRAEIRRSGANGRYETHKSPNPSTEAASTPRVKIFEPDIYDNTKTHSRKPPKGIKNWFDGFDISSDEEEDEPVELPANPPRPSVEGIPSDFSPYGVSAPERTPVNGTYPARAMQSHLYPIDPARAAGRHRVHSRSSESSTVTEDSSGVAGGHKRGGESRLAHSRLDSQSVLSLSSESEEEREVLSTVRDSRYANEDGETLGPNLPSPVPRPLNNSQTSIQRGGLRASESTAQTTSGSIPIRLRDSTAAPMAVEDSVDRSEAKPLLPRASPSTSNEAEPLPAKSRTTTRSGQEREGLKSAGGETSSSAPSDASHVMAVTEEEMMLLELMRKKRAAMQKNSFREGYRLALKQEQEVLSKRRQSAHNSVSKLLEERANRESRSPDPANAPVQKTEAVVEHGQTQNQPPQNRYSVFQKIPGVEKGFNIDRYLAMEGAQEEPPLSPNAESVDDPQDEPERYVAKMARMERFLMMKPSLADAIYDGRPLSGTEIETDTTTMTATEDEDAPSPMARLAVMGRDDSGVVSPSLYSHDEENEPPEESEVGYDEHHKKVRAFLQSRYESADASLTALPQMDNEQPFAGGRGTAAVLPPSIPQEELGPPELPQNSEETETLDTSDIRTPRPPFLEPEQPIPQPTSKFQVRSHVSTIPDSAPRELPTPRDRPASISTGFASPLSQSFSASSPRDNAPTDASKSPRYSKSPYIASTARRISKLPTKIDTTGGKTVGRITSMSSMTSAGEDVLAAWAELGGGSDALAARRKGR